MVVTMNLQALVDPVKQDPELAWRGKYYSFQMRLEMGDYYILYRPENSKLILVTEDVAMPGCRREPRCHFPMLMLSDILRKS